MKLNANSEIQHQQYLLKIPCSAGLSISCHIHIPCGSGSSNALLLEHIPSQWSDTLHAHSLVLPLTQTSVYFILKLRFMHHEVTISVDTLMNLIISGASVIQC